MFFPMDDLVLIVRQNKTKIGFAPNVCGKFTDNFCGQSRRISQWEDQVVQCEFYQLPTKNFDSLQGDHFLWHCHGLLSPGTADRKRRRIREPQSVGGPDKNCTASRALTLHPFVKTSGWNLPSVIGLKTLVFDLAGLKAKFTARLEGYLKLTFCFCDTSDTGYSLTRWMLFTRSDRQKRSRSVWENVVVVLRTAAKLPVFSSLKQNSKCNIFGFLCVKFFSLRKATKRQPKASALFERESSQSVQRFIGRTCKKSSDLKIQKEDKLVSFLARTSQKHRFVVSVANKDSQNANADSEGGAFCGTMSLCFWHIWSLCVECLALACLHLQLVNVRFCICTIWLFTCKCFNLPTLKTEYQDLHPWLTPKSSLCTKHIAHKCKKNFILICDTIIKLCTRVLSLPNAHYLKDSAGSAAQRSLSWLCQEVRVWGTR